VNLNRLLLGIAMVWIAAFWIGCVAIPISSLLARVDRWDLLLDPIILHIASLTAMQALMSAVISAAIALPLGIWIGSGDIRSRRWAQTMLALPFGVPTVVAGLAWVVLLGRHGIFASLDWAYSFKAVVLAHVVFNVPWIALWVAQSRTFLPQSRLEAARTLGAAWAARFRYVIWPQVKWAFFSAACQTFVFCAMSFALILVLGGGPPVQTLEVSLYSHIRFGSLDVSSAVACAIWELVVTLLPWCLVVYFQSKEESSGSRSVRERGAAVSGAAWMSWLSLTASFLLFLPYLSVFHVSLPDSGSGVGWVRTLAEDSIRKEVVPALQVSLKLALATALGVILTAIFAVMTLESLPTGRSGSSGHSSFRSSRGQRALRSVALFLMGVPSGISALVLGLGLWLAYGRWIDPFSGSFFAIIALQVTIFFPTAFRILWPVARDREKRLIEAAMMLGASRTQAFWTVEWPRWRPPLLGALAMVIGASLGEVSAVSLFYSENLVPLPLLISRWSTQYRFADAQSVAALLLVLCSGIIFFAFPATGKQKV
jgi:thiamine transport system permease protein